MSAEIRGFREQNTRVLNAMREYPTDLRSQVDDGLAEMRRGFTGMRDKLDAAAAGQQIVGLLNTLMNRARIRNHGRRVAVGSQCGYGGFGG